MTIKKTKDRDVRKWKNGLPLNKPIKYGPMWNPHDPKEIRELADELMEWAKLPTSVEINDFPISKNINPYDFKRIKDDYFQGALSIANYTLNSRQKKLVNCKVYEKEMFFKYLRLYDKDYKEDEDEKIAKRVANFKESMGNITVVDHMLTEKKYDN
jgi:hypothetical protein